MNNDLHSYIYAIMSAVTGEELKNAIISALSFVNGDLDRG